MRIFCKKRKYFTTFAKQKLNGRRKSLRKNRILMVGRTMVYNNEYANFQLAKMSCDIFSGNK